MMLIVTVFIYLILYNVRVSQYVRATCVAWILPFNVLVTLMQLISMSKA